MSSESLKMSRLHVWWQSLVLCLGTQWLSQCKLILPVIALTGRWSELLPSVWEDSSELRVHPWRAVHRFEPWHCTNTSYLSLTVGADGLLHLSAGFEVVCSNSASDPNFKCVVWCWKCLCSIIRVWRMFTTAVLYLSIIISWVCRFSVRAGSCSRWVLTPLFHSVQLLYCLVKGALSSMLVMVW